MYALGLNSAYHESSACLLRDGIIVAAVEEERFTRIKHAKPARIDNPHELPLHSIRFCLKTAGIHLGDIGHIGFSLNPLRRLENATITESVTPGGWGSRAGEEEFHRNLLRIPDLLQDQGFRGQFVWLDHPSCHAASAFYPSCFPEAAVLTLDGIGEITTAAFAFGQGPSLHVLREVRYPASLGFLWEKLSQFLGFTEYDACKVMGLASYGNPHRFQAQFQRFARCLSDGGFELDVYYLQFRTHEFGPLESLLGTHKREAHQPLTTDHHDIAAALQAITNEIVMHMVQHLHRLTGASHLCMAGGVALNCITNRIVYEKGPFNGLYIQPAAHDAGTAIGAAFLVDESGVRHVADRTMSHASFGPSFSDDTIEQAIRRSGLPYRTVPPIERVAARLIATGNVVGWFQGAMEIGPRALGHRSLLADPRDLRVREILNRRIKHREAFRPFGPSVLAERARDWFEIDKETSASDFMLIAYPVRKSTRSRIPAVVHVDGTSRVQTVRRELQPRYYALIEEFERLTGVPMVLNTSLNDDEPIVCTPEDALGTYRKTGMDYLAIGNFLVARSSPALSRLDISVGHSS